MKYALFFTLLLPLGILAQDKGVRFEHGLSWQEIKARAKAENKYIFVDCYTTWCGPCKYMSAKIFPQEEVGNFFNGRFVSVQVQMDSSTVDADNIKAWYADAHELDATYKIRAYPTFLYFSPDGELVHRMVGGGEADAFIALSAKALDPAKQYYPLLKKALQQGAKDTATLFLAIKAAESAYDKENETVLLGMYLNEQQDLLTKANLSLIAPTVSNSRNKYFRFLIDSAQKIDKIMGDDYVGYIVREIIAREEVLPMINASAGDPDWKAIHARTVGKYPVFGAEPVAMCKIIYYENKKNWIRFQQAVTVYLERYGSHVSPGMLNAYAWSIFLDCPDQACMRQALAWSKRSLEKEQQPQYMDTYANILYKLGKKEEALSWERKAVAQSGSDAATMQPNLDKMVKGEKTWNN